MKPPSLHALCRALATLVLALSLAGPAAGTEWSLCEQAIQTVARQSAVPANVLRAVALAESGRADQGQMRPWPWTVNAAGKGSWFPTREDARAYAQDVLATGSRNLDIGCFQLNHRWHGGKFPSLDAMFDPLENARQAAAFLADLHAETGDWTLAAGAYHSRTPELADRYRTRFETLLAALPPDRGPMPPPARHNAFPLLQGGAPSTAGSLVPMRPAQLPLLRGAPAALIGG
ncbi:transglycosylase SLT domain-containing protein [Gemmobacter nectariphilus]|uniref:transglycosylase SLT domain-containing protein n=1 Tax=Gemmobacter nectariphilus TaxID=220343 RepID=UPI000557F8CE|nr:transglycosylase SLT domain-containing protein [Gemmobacter nectariphilus]